MTEDLLQTFGLRKEFGGLVAVDSVDFTVPEGSIVSLIGPNGAGKTTFFNMLTGVYKPTSGTVTLLGEDVTGKPPHAITARGIGRTFQVVKSFETMSVIDNVIVGALVHSTVMREARRKAHEVLEFTGLGARAHVLASDLVPSEKRRLEVARALATEPKLLLLDEPTAGMNPQESAEFTAFVGRLREEQELTVLMIEHDMRVVMGVSDRVSVLDYGEKIAEGTPQEIQKNERVIEAYLGSAAVTS